MIWRAGWVITRSGQLEWSEGLTVTDEGMKLAYHGSQLVEYIIETSAIMGVRVGVA